MTEDIETLRLWIRIIGVITAIAVTSVPVIYSFSPWRSRPIGRVMMYQGIAFAVAMDLSLLISFIQLRNILVIFWINAIVLTGICVATCLVSYSMLKINYDTRKWVFKVQFTASVYDILKKIALIWLPAFGSLYFALSPLWGLPHAEQVSGTVLALDTFLGVVLGISKSQYDKSNDRFDGVVDVVVNEEGKKIFKLNIDGDLDELDQKDQILFKVRTRPES